MYSYCYMHQRMRIQLWQDWVPNIFLHFCYRNSISATLSALPKQDDKASTITSNSERGGGGGSGTEDCSIGSAGSLAKRNQHNKEGLPWDDEDVESGKTVKLIDSLTAGSSEILCLVDWFAIILFYAKRKTDILIMLQ